METLKERIPSKRSFLIAVSILYLFTFILTAFFTDRWGYYQLFFSINFILFIALVFSLSKTDIKKRKWIMIPLFLVPFLLQLILLFNEPSFSQDIMRLQFRGEAISDGLEPYEQFEINKPPLYIWMVGLISNTLGTSQIIFRSVFVIFNSLIPVTMFIIGKTHSSRNWKMGAFAYALWPVALMETGIAGHFDPVVALAVLVSYLFLTKNNPLVSGLFLGAGFALKMFPVFIAPFFFLSFGGIKNRSLFILGFISIPIISALPFLITNPSGITEYLIYQSSGWGSSMSFQFIFDMTPIPATVIFGLFTSILATGMIFLIFAGLKGIDRHHRVFIIPFILLSIIPAGYFLIILIAGSTGFQLLIGILPVLLSFTLIILAFFAIMRNDNNNNKKKVENWITATIPVDRVAAISALSLILLLFTSAQFHPWYLLWTAPFVFSSSPDRFWPFLLISGPLHYNSYPPWEMGGMF
jgi:hypothetical protein